MEFCKVYDLNGLDLSLPKDNKFNIELKVDPQKEVTPKFYIGGTVWGDKSYTNVIYPKGARSSEFLSLYSKNFNSIELNSTHYKIPSIETVKRWKSLVNDKFRFCPKFPQLISHRFGYTRRNHLVEKFLESVFNFEDNLGISFIQFPPKFSSNHINDLFGFIRFLPLDFELAIEFRHQSWFEMNVLLKLRDFLLDKNVFLLITDALGRRDVCHQLLLGKKVFVRFVGNNLHESDNIRIENWVKRLVNWKQYGIDEVFFFIHQPVKGNAAYTIKHLIESLNLGFNISLKPPIFVPQVDYQQELF